MSQNHLAERNVCEIAALHTQAFSDRKAATNEGVLTPQWKPDVLHPNCLSLPVKLDHSFACCSTDTFPRNVRRIAVRLPGFSRRLGDTRDQRHCPGPSLDDLLQTVGTRQHPDTTVGTRFVRSRQQYFANRSDQSRYRRYTGSTPVPESAGKRHSARTSKKEQQTAVSTGTVLGYAGHQRVRLHGQEVCAADSVSFGACQWQSKQVGYRAGVGTQSGSGDNEQVRPVVVRFLVHAGAADIAAVVAKDAGYRPGTVRYRIIHAPRSATQTPAWTTQRDLCKNP